MYRALALKAMEQPVSLEDAEALREMAENSVMQLDPSGEGNRVLLDGRDVTQRIREADVTAAASRVHRVGQNCLPVGLRAGVRTR